MSTPTREQVIEWAKEAGVRSTEFWAIGFFPEQSAKIERLCTLAMSAGRDQGLREAVAACINAAHKQGTLGRQFAAEDCVRAIEQLRAK